MRTIVKPQDSIDRLWGKQKVHEADTYRLMRYVLRVDHEDKVLLHNVVTGHLVLLTKEEADQLASLPAKPTESTQELIASHFLVPRNYDEYRSVNQLRSILQRRSTGDAITNYVILPTTYCNAHCFYCYESGYPHVHMTEETGRKVIDFILEHRRGKPVQLAWFGGEPLLGAARIDQICTALKEQDVPYTGSIITNGYLLDEETAEKCAGLWNLKRVQITLDGTEPVYNRVKAYANAQGSPFQRVMRNVDLLSKKEVLTVIRLNLDFYNKQDIRTLMEELAKRYSGNRFVKVYVSVLYDDQGFEPVHHTTEQYIELLGIYDEYTETLARLNIGLDKRRIPFLKTHQCIADDPHSIVIQPDGGFCRCEHECVNDAYGDLEAGILDPGKPLRWKEPIFRSDYCPECRMYPFCYMISNCLDAKTPCNERIRLLFQNRYEGFLQSVFLQEKWEDGENERVCSS